VCCQPLGIYSRSVIVHGTNTVTGVSHFWLLQNVKDYKLGDVKRPLLREMLVWMIKETERGAERPLLREMLVWMISEKELKPGSAERPLLTVRDARLDDQRDRAQARRHRETTPERDAHLDDLRERA